ncbi:MAG TPA: hypothetical protein VFY51_10940 [Pyrinomonadaceae bacterium]|nr:hypothetical protein [Pyrinomonadaceae bacterium]
MIKTLLHDEWRFLTFRPMSQAIRTHWRAYFVFGLIFTWLAGIGRYWDNPRAGLWQYAGLGSVAYVFVLALFIWLLLAPLRPKNWSYQNVLLFLTLTAPPAVLYAIPVEKFMSLENARTANAWFLGLIAAWRVALLVVFLRRTGGLSRAATAVATLLPITIIVFVLALLNLEHVVFDFMGGRRSEQRTANDAAYGVVWVMAVYSFLASPVLLIIYLVFVYRAQTSR